MSASREEWVLSQPSLANNGVAAPDQPAPSPLVSCRLPEHNRAECRFCNVGIEVVQTVKPVAPAPVTAPHVAQPAPASIAALAKTEPVPAPDPTSPSAILLRAAGEFAAAIDRCSRLSTRIAALEASLEFAMKERDEAEAAKEVAQETLKKLVVQ